MKKVHNKIIAITLFLLLIFSFNTFATLNLPSPTKYKYVNDYVGVVDNNSLNKIISIGKELEDKTGAQEIIVVINSTNGIDIESYANNLFRTWGIGESGKDNGLLLLVSIQDKSWRVEVGRGLEGAIPDVITNRVMTSLAKPSFVSGNYSEGLLNAYSAFSDYIASEYNTTLDKSLNITLPSNDYATNNSYNTKGIGIVGGIFIFLLIIDIIFNRGRLFRTLLNLLFISNINRRNGPRGGGSSGGGGFGGFGGGSSNGGGSSGNW